MGVDCSVIAKAAATPGDLGKHVVWTSLSLSDYQDKSMLAANFVWFPTLILDLSLMA